MRWGQDDNRLLLLRVNSTRLDSTHTATVHTIQKKKEEEKRRRKRRRGEGRRRKRRRRVETTTTTHMGRDSIKGLTAAVIQSHTVPCCCALASKTTRLAPPPRPHGHGHRPPSRMCIINQTSERANAVSSESCMAADSKAHLSLFSSSSTSSAFLPFLLLSPTYN